tara:strand:+ start:491 stop:832 length:342 start_codon:yes stop_codon:yes gene_type:complete
MIQKNLNTYVDYVTEYIYKEYLEDLSEEFYNFSTDDLSEYVNEKLLENINDDDTAEQFIIGSLSWVDWNEIVKRIDTEYHNLYCRECNTDLSYNQKEFCTDKCKKSYVDSLVR